MWYDACMPKVLPDKIIENADKAVAFAVQVRTFHARRTDRRSQQRNDDIEHALQRLHEAMAPLKSEIGRFAYGPQTTIAETNRQTIREASAAIQRERRKLWKLRGKKKPA